MANDIIGFYEGRKKNQVGMSIDDVRGMNNEELETDHHYIQWIFPDTEKSMAVLTSPVLSQLDIDTFLENAELQITMLEMFAKMLTFYGFRLEIGGREMRKGYNFEERAKEWITPRNHNFLRLTRIMRSMSLLGQKELAKTLHNGLCEIYEDEKYKKTIGPITKEYWDESICKGDKK